MIEFGGKITREMALRDHYMRKFLGITEQYGFPLVSEDGFVQLEDQQSFLTLMEILVHEHFRLDNLLLQFGTVDNPSCIRVSLTAPENIKS